MMTNPVEEDRTRVLPETAKPRPELEGERLRGLKFLQEKRTRKDVPPADLTRRDSLLDHAVQRLGNQEGHAQFAQFTKAMFGVLGGIESNLGFISNAAEIPGLGIVQVRDRQDNDTWRTECLVMDDSDGKIRIIKAGQNPHQSDEGSRILDNRYGPAVILPREVTGGTAESLPTRAEDLEDFIVAAFRNGSARILQNDGREDPRLATTYPLAKKEN